MLGAARTRVHASHGGAHGPENRREKVPKSARAGTSVQREERRGKRRQQQQQQQAAAAAVAAAAATRGAEKEEQEEASKRGPLRRRLP